MFVELGGDCYGGINTDNIDCIGRVRSYLDVRFRLVITRIHGDPLTVEYETEQEAIAKRKEIVDAINGRCHCGKASWSEMIMTKEEFDQELIRTAKEREAND